MKKGISCAGLFIIISVVLNLTSGACTLQSIDESNTLQSNSIKTVIGGEEDFAAVRSLSGNSVVVTLNTCGGNVDPGTITVKHGPRYGMLPTPTREGYLFTGWWTLPSGAGTLVTSETKVRIKEDHVLYAGWQSKFSEKISGAAVIYGNGIVFSIAFGEAGTGIGVLAEDGASGYVQDSTEQYQVISFSHDSSTGLVMAGTEAKSGVSYSLEFVLNEGIIASGTINRSTEGATETGTVAGIVSGAEANVGLYSGYGIYYFPVPETQRTSFNLVIDFDTGTVRGSWCESCPDWEIGTKAIYGTIVGTLSGSQITAVATQYPEYNQFTGEFKAITVGAISADLSLITGTTTIEADGMTLQGGYNISRVM